MDSVASEHHYFWLTGLSDISRAELFVSSSKTDDVKSDDPYTETKAALTKAVHHYHIGLTALTVSTYCVKGVRLLI